LKTSQQDVVMLEVHKTLQHAGIRMTVGRLYSLLDADVGLEALHPREYQKILKNSFQLSLIPIMRQLRIKSY